MRRPQIDVERTPMKTRKMKMYTHLQFLSYKRHIRTAAVVSSVYCFGFELLTKPL